MTIVAVGNLTRDPELRFTQGGKAIASLSVAESRKKGEERVTFFWDVTAWEKLGENACASLKKGNRVVVVGEADPQEWVDKEGKTQRRLGINARYIGAELSFDTAVVDERERTQAAAPKAGKPLSEDEEPF